MNARAHQLSAFSAVMHVTIGVAALLNIGPRFLPPSWVVIFEVVPAGQWIYPALWLLTGLVAVSGIWAPAALRLGFQMSSGLFLAWGLAGIWAWQRGSGGNLQGLSANLFIAGCLWALSEYVALGVRSGEIQPQIDRLEEQVNRAERQ